MNLDFTPEENAFREEVRAFIKENYPAELRKAQDEGLPLTKDEYLLWHKVLAKKGWATPSWPAEHGGTGWTPTQKYIWSEETARADCLTTGTRIRLKEGECVNAAGRVPSRRQR